MRGERRLLVSSTLDMGLGCEGLGVEALLASEPLSQRFISKSETLDFCYLLIKTHSEHREAGLTPAGREVLRSYMGMAFSIPHTRQIPDLGRNPLPVPGGNTSPLV